MTDNFEAWINSMSDEDYDIAYNEEFSEKQREKALNIREPLSEEELESMRREQESGTRQVYDTRQDVTQRGKPVYDTRDLPEKPKVVQEGNTTVIIQKEETSKREFEQRRKPTVRERIKSIGQKIVRFFRRNKTPQQT